MKLKIVFILIGIISIILPTTIASAMSIQTNMNIVDGMARIRYTVNNNTTEIQINGSARIEVNVNDSTFDYSIDKTGECAIKTNLNEEYEINSDVGEKEETFSDSGTFTFVLCFIFLFILLTKRRVFFG